MTSLPAILSTVTASFLASLVEVVEAFTILLAVGLTQSWRPAFAGAALALLALAALVVIFGPLLALVPIAALHFVVGSLLILFGMRWLTTMTIELQDTGMSVPMSRPRHPASAITGWLEALRSRT
jgi:uncharacterized membrane protein